MKRMTVIGALLFMAFGISCTEPEPPTTPKFAVYYTWWSNSSWGKLGPNYPRKANPNPPLPANLGTNGCYSSNNFVGNKELDVPELPSDGQFAYDQDKPGLVEQDVRQAHDAGLNGFTVNWQGNGKADQTINSTIYGRRMQKVFDAAIKLLAEEKRFRLILEVETARRPPVAELINDVRFLLDRYTGHPSLDHTWSEDPEVIVRLSRNYSNADMQKLEDAVGDRAFLIGDVQWYAWGDDDAAIWDGNSAYWAGQDPYGNPHSFGQLKAMADKIHAAGDVWLSPVTPGYDDTLLRPPGFCLPRRDGETLRRVYEGNKASSPDGWVFISWNEISENTHVVPLERYGTRYLDVLRGLE